MPGQVLNSFKVVLMVYTYLYIIWLHWNLWLPKYISIIFPNWSTFLNTYEYLVLCFYYVFHRGLEPKYLNINDDKRCHRRSKHFKTKIYCPKTPGCGTSDDHSAGKDCPSADWLSTLVCSSFPADLPIATLCDQTCRVIDKIHSIRSRLF